MKDDPLAPKFRSLFATAIIGALAYAPAIAQTDVETNMPGTVFLDPTPLDNYSSSNEVEITSDHSEFEAKGFSFPDWKFFSNLSQDVLVNVAIPDWMERNKTAEMPKVPDFRPIEIASAYILGGQFNDLIVLSNLPGDCTDYGCLTQVYSLENDKWTKQFEFVAPAFGWKRDADTGAVYIASVGVMDVPSHTFRWENSQLIPQ